MRTYKVSVSSIVNNHLAFKTYYIESDTEESAIDSAMARFESEHSCCAVICGTATV